ncbi:hypothetical protein CVT25_005817 [Psilocybe cyanescens]|uniref:Uncharacterized protein n=1 Tax=Psilocybe cyanescens TaxID=93625 RepID=A0A409VV56_PSICY|nr:hypothetical protein CVT25_005817 [Psilocybe cyanescens]
MHTNFWEFLDEKAKVYKSKSRLGWQILRLSFMLFDLLIMRNMHSFEGADIPVIFTDWSSEQLDAALGYWEELSKGEWSQDEQRRRCNLTHDDYFNFA